MVTRAAAKVRHDPTALLAAAGVLAVLLDAKARELRAYALGVQLHMGRSDLVVAFAREVLGEAGGTNP